MIDAGCFINGKSLNHLFYADDSVLMAPSAEALQMLLDECDKYAKQTELTYNTKKTVCMLVRPKWLKDLKSPHITLNGSTLDFVDNHCYLGVQLSQDVKDELDMKKQMKSIYARGNGLIRQFKHCNSDVKVKLFKSYCSSVYACALWKNYTKSVYKKVKGAYSNIFRHLLKFDRTIDSCELMVNNKVDTFNVIIRKLVFSLRCRLLNSDNSLVKTVIGCQFFYSSPMFNHWETSLGKM